LRADIFGILALESLLPKIYNTTSESVNDQLAGEENWRKEVANWRAFPPVPSSTGLTECDMMGIASVSTEQSDQLATCTVDATTAITPITVQDSDGRSHPSSSSEVGRRLPFVFIYKEETGNGDGFSDEHVG